MPQETTVEIIVKKLKSMYVAIKQPKQNHLFFKVEGYGIFCLYTTNSGSVDYFWSETYGVYEPKQSIDLEFKNNVY